MTESVPARTFHALRRPRLPRARTWVLGAVLLPLLAAGLGADADAASPRACRRGCKVLLRGCIEAARTEYGALRAGCTGEGKRACRRSARRDAKQVVRGCRRYRKRECVPCCKVGGLDECAKAQAEALPAEPQEPGDPVRGRYELLNGDFMTCGVPYKLWGIEAFRELIAGAFGTGAADAPRLPDRVGANADMPYFLNVFTAPDGAEVMNANCLMCHGGRFDGELVVGLGNATADFTAGAGSGIPGGPLPDDLLDLVGLDGAERDQLRRIAARGAALTPLTMMRTVGMNPAELFAVILMTHHDRETLAWSDEPVIPFIVRDHDGTPIENPLVTSDPPPWWRAHKKNALFYNGMARGDHRGTMALATSVCVDDRARAREVDAQFRDIQAFVASVRPPAYRRPVDAALAAEGGALFEEHCATCHGTYAAREEEETYPNLLLPLDVIGTDPVVAELGVVHAPELVDWYNDSFYGAITRMVPDDPFPGYMPPPLDGIWATAPFLHNGSVPTVELVLNSRARPTYWRRVDLDSTHFDEEALGWPWVEVTAAEAAAPGDGPQLIYDTTQWSQSNAGHTFGDHLTPDERRAIIEYLKTL